MYILKLYIAGQTPRSERAITNLHRICKENLGKGYKIEIIDILGHPQLAEREKIIATPTLIKELPLPLRRVIGDLADTEKVLSGLALPPDVSLCGKKETGDQ